MKNSNCCLILLPAFVFTFSENIHAQSPYFDHYEKSQGFVAHEWGTFTTLLNSQGQNLSGLELEEERLPYFVRNTSYNYKAFTSTKGFVKGSCILKNVTVKMETPVLYFYHSLSNPLPINVGVEFLNGIISQWYPAAVNYQYIHDSTFDAMFSPIVVPTIDFARPRKGWLNWEASVLPLSDTTPVSSDSTYETEQWRMPRATKSNMLKAFLFGAKEPTYYDFEKFLFYRGIANFSQALEVQFSDQSNLILKNNGENPLSYVLVYEKDATGNSVVWWSGTLENQEKKLVKKNAEISWNEERRKFIDRLVCAGLYEDEAQAMLNTWQKSYFEHEGLKVFWIVPEAFTAKILPLKIAPNPDAIKRVLIGRTEILTPQFEQKLAALDSTDFKLTYQSDRFYSAYQILRQNKIPYSWQIESGGINPSEEFVSCKTDSSNSLLLQTNKKNNGLPILYPNPTRDAAFIESDDVGNLSELFVFNNQGQSIHVPFFIENGKILLNVSRLSVGFYILQLAFSDNSKKAVKMVVN